MEKQKDKEMEEKSKLNVKEYLLPCPFCGRSADAIKSTSVSGYEIKYIQCKNFRNRTNDFVICSENKLMIEKWNRREKEAT